MIIGYHCELLLCLNREFINGEKSNLCSFILCLFFSFLLYFKILSEDNYGTLCSGIILLMCNYEWKNILLWRNCYFYTGTFILLCNYYGEILIFLIILSEDFFFFFVTALHCRKKQKILFFLLILLQVLPFATTPNCRKK
mgnify:CR=1 FL=1